MDIESTYRIPEAHPDPQTLILISRHSSWFPDTHLDFQPLIFYFQTLIFYFQTLILIPRHLSWFPNILQENPCNHPVVILRDAAFVDVEGLVRYVYRGEVDVQPERLQNFLKTAELLKIKGLAEQSVSKNGDQDDGGFAEVRGPWWGCEVVKTLVVLNDIRFYNLKKLVTSQLYHPVRRMLWSYYRAYCGRIILIVFFNCTLVYGYAQIFIFKFLPFL